MNNFSGKLILTKNPNPGFKLIFGGEGGVGLGRMQCSCHHVEDWAAASLIIGSI